MKKKFITLLLLTTPCLSYASECLNVQRTTVIKTKELKKVDSSKFPPAMQAQMKAMQIQMEQYAQEAAKPVLTTEYWTEDSYGLVSNKGVNFINFNTGEQVRIDHTKKSYSNVNFYSGTDLLMNSLTDSRKSPSKSALPHANKASATIKADEQDFATGKDFNFAGIPCSEYKIGGAKIKDVDVKPRKLMAHQRNQKPRGLEAKSHCISLNQPASYFRILKLHDEKFSKKMNSEVLLKFKEANNFRPTFIVPSFELFVLGQEKRYTTPYYTGFVLQKHDGPEYELYGDPEQDTEVKRLRSLELGTTTVVQSIGTQCPDAKLWAKPDGYQEIGHREKSAPKF